LIKALSGSISFFYLMVGYIADAFLTGSGLANFAGKFVYVT